MEYWVVYPGEEIVEVFRLESNGKYENPIKFTKEEMARSSVLSTFEMKVDEIFVP